MKKFGNQIKTCAIVVLLILLSVQALNYKQVKKQNQNFKELINGGHFENYIEKYDTVYLEIDLNDSIKEIHQEEVNKLKYRLKKAKQHKDTVVIVDVQDRIIVQQDTVIRYLEKNDTLQKELIAYQDTTIRKLNVQKEVVENEKEKAENSKNKWRKGALIAGAISLIEGIIIISRE